MKTKWQLLERKMMPATVLGADPLTFWRERILFILCFIGVVLGPLVLTPSIWLSAREKLWNVVIIDLIAYTIVVAVLFSRRLKLVTRAGILLGLIYFLALGLLLALGQVGAGYLWLFGASVLISSLFSLRAALWTIVVNVMALGLVGFYIAYGDPFWARVFDNPLQKWFVLSVNFVLLNILVTVMTALLMDALKRGLEKEQEISASLKESEKKYRLLADNTIDCIWVMDLDTRFTYVNPAIETIMGYTPEEWVGTTLSQYCDEENLRKMVRQIDSAFQALPRITTATFEAVMRNRSGKPVHLEITGRIVLNDHGSPIGLQGLTRNITERKQIESRLQQAQKHEAIGTLAGGIAHDFNNILSAVVGYTELAMDEAAGSRPLYAYLQEVVTACLRAKDLVRQILTFARQTQEDIRPVQVGLIIGEVLRLLRSTVPRTIDFSTGIQSASLVMADPTYVHQLMMNLCTNAVQAMEDQGGTLQVTLEDVSLEPEGQNPGRGLRDGRYLKLTVADSGPGIPPEVMDNIFDPYFTTKGPGEGTGMGLAVVHGIVQKCKGKITVSSQAGQGSCFEVLLPALAPSRKAPLENPEPLPVGTERILVVEDEAVIAMMNRKILEALGYDVVMKTDGVAALQVFRENPDDFQLLITDMTMPHMTGDQLIRQIKTIRPDMKTILCTGYSKKITKDLLAEIGPDALIYKPIVRADLAGAVRRVLGNQEESK